MYMSRKCWSLAIVLAIGVGVSSVLAEDKVTFYTEDYRPYNFPTDTGRVEGISTDVVRLIMEEAGLAYEIRLLPWSRAFREAGANQRAFIYSLARTKEREHKFDWIAPLAKPDFYLYAREDEVRPVTREAIERGEFRVHCVNYDASCGILKRAGFQASDIWQNAAQATSPPTLLLRHRIDLYLGDRNHETLDHIDYIQGVKPTLKVESDLTFYLAAGMHVDENLRNKVRAAYQKLIEKQSLNPVLPFNVR